MSIYDRESQYINLLGTGSLSVRELSERLFISEPTVRRDIIALKKRGLISCHRGTVSLVINSPDKRIPAFIRDTEHNSEKKQIALKAAALVKDGDAVMLDASTTAFYLLPYLAEFKNILVITNGAKTALEAAALGIRTICTGGEMTLESFSYVGADAERTLRRYNADIAFFSCRGLSEGGLVTDNSILENAMRRIMIKNSNKSYLLCDRSKTGKKYLNTLVSSKDIDGVIS